MRSAIFILASLLLAIACQARTIAVDDDGPADFNNIQAAIDDSNDGDVIEVQPGIYTGTGNRDIDFLGKAITVRSTNPNDPNIFAATTIDCNGTEDEPHRGFYFRSGEDGNSVLNGFTITNGVRDVDYWPDPCGGAIYCYLSSPTLMNCRFTGNTALGGGAIFNSFSSPTVANCTFSENRAQSLGGGMLNLYSSPTLTNCRFIRNSVGYGGGGMYNGWGSSPTVTNCTFSGNSANNGGGMCNGMISPHTYTAPKLTNCTFSGNRAGAGGAIRNVYSIATLTNCILWGDAPPEIDAPGGTVVITYSDVEGGWPGEGNIDADPCFVSPGYWGANGVWVDGDYHLLGSSPCIDAGDPNYVAGPNETDLEGNPRIVNDIVDMGAYEAILSIVEVAIDVKPGSYPNAINLGSYGLVPVAILSSEDFDATTVDADTVELAGAGVAVRGKSNKFMAHQEDVSGDGLLDLVVQVATANLDPNSVQDGYAILTGSTFGGQDIAGEDEITIVPVE